LSDYYLRILTVWEEQYLYSYIKEFIMSTNLKGFVMGKCVLLGLIALTAAVFMMGSCEGLVDVVKDLDNIDDDDNNGDGDDTDGDSVTLPSEYDGYTQITSVAAYNKLADKTNYVILIRNITDFQKIGKEGGYPLDGVYVQTKDITITNDDNWTPIGSGNASALTTFQGTFNGNGKKIIPDNISYASTLTESSFFGNTKDATFTDVHIGAGSITASGSLGGIASICYGTTSKGTTFTNCSNEAYLKATVSKAASVGGICKAVETNSSITNCWNTGKIEISGSSSTALDAGGISGTSKGIISASYNAGIVTASIGNSTYIGGVVAYFTGGEIVACYNTGTISATGSMENRTFGLGGIVGDISVATATVTACYSIGKLENTVVGTGAPKMLIGGICGLAKADTSFTACFWKKLSDTVIYGIGGAGDKAATATPSNSGIYEFGEDYWPSADSSGTGNDAWGTQYWNSLGLSSNSSYPSLKCGEGNGAA
jgi:hypothetical protein